MKRYRELGREHAEASALVELLPPLRAARARPRGGAASCSPSRPATPRWPRWRSEEVAAPPPPTSSACSPSCRRRCCRATPTTRATPSSRSAPAPAATSRRCSPPTWRACTCAIAERQRLAHRGHVGERERTRRLQGDGRSAIEGDDVYARAEVRVGRPPRAARAGHRDAGPHPHQRLHGRGDARARRGRGGEARPEPSCASTPSAPAAPAASTSTRPTARSASPTCRPASSPSARTTARSTATRPRRWRCWRRGCATRSAAERAAKEAATRKGLIGSGDRSDRIRTYNFPQGRVTDHRIGLTLYKLQAILDGDLDEVIAALQAAQAAEQLAALESGEA